MDPSVERKLRSYHIWKNIKQKYDEMVVDELL